MAFAFLHDVSVTYYRPAVGIRTNFISYTKNYIFITTNMNNLSQIFDNQYNFDIAKIISTAIVSILPKFICFIYNFLQNRKGIGFSFRKISEENIYRFLISNTGTTPIERKDFDDKIKIDFGVKINNFKLKKVEPNFLSPEIYLNKDSIEINPLLLNPEDKIIIEISSSEMINEPKFIYRISNIKDILKIDEKSMAFKMIRINYFSYILLIITLLSNANSIFSEISPNHGIAAASIFGVIAFLTFISYSKYKFNKIYTEDLFDGDDYYRVRYEYYLDAILFFVWSLVIFSLYITSIWPIKEFSFNSLNINSLIKLIIDFGWSLMLLKIIADIFIVTIISLFSYLKFNNKIKIQQS